MVTFGVIYLLIYHINEKFKSRQSFFKSKKTWMIISMLLYCIYLVLAFNFELDNHSDWMTYFNLIIRKYLNSISMVFVAYYFFSKSVKGYKDKAIWKVIMKGLLYIAFMVMVVILFYFWNTYYSAKSV